MLRSEFQYTAAIKWKPNSRRNFKHIQSPLERIYIQSRLLGARESCHWIRSRATVLNDYHLISINISDSVVDLVTSIHFLLGSCVGSLLFFSSAQSVRWTASDVDLF